MELAKTTINTDLSKGIPALASIIRLTYHFLENPVSGITNIAEIMNDIEIMRSLVDSTDADVQQILRDISDIVASLARLLISITSDPRV
jgi:hypothetical protein